MQSTQIKDLRLKLDQAVAENSQIQELLLPATLTMAFSNALSATKTSFTSQTGNRGNNQQFTPKPFLGKLRPSKLAAGKDGTTNPDQTCRYCKDTGHLLENCVRLEARNKFVAERERKEEGGFKLTAPAPQGQGCKGGAMLDPPSLTRFEDRFEQIVRTLTSSAVSNETKQRILKRAVSQCPSITMEFLGLKVPSLLDSGSMVTLIHEAYFNKNILPLLRGSAEELAEAHSLFRLSAANNQDMPVSRYFEADISILGFPIPSVGFLVVKDPSTVLESQYSTRTPRVIGCNLIWLGYEEFGKVYGFEAFETFMCPKEVHPLIFAQMCTLYHQGKDQAKPDLHASNSLPKDQQTETIQVTNSNINFHSITEDLSPLDATLGQVWIGNPCKVICIPANSVKVVEGKTSRKARRLSCMIEARSQNNLPLGVMVNCTAVTPSKSNKVPVTLINTNSYNVWIRQQLLAADIVEGDHCPWDYHSTMSRDGSEVQVLFQTVPTPDVQADIFSVDATETEKEAGELEDD